MTTSFTLNIPELGNLDEIEQNIRQASVTQGGREALAKFLLREEYLLKLIPLVEIAEDLESLSDLHRLCNIMKALILMNDNSIIEHLVDDNIIIGVVGVSLFQTRVALPCVSASRVSSSSDEASGPRI